MVRGRIHSVETCGTVDGPGIRYVVFMQGCLLRCQYCHNPDTWDLKGGKTVTREELLQDMEGYVPYMTFSGGGVTVSGGEPLLQAEFVAELFKGCKERDIHTALDTSGGCFTGHGVQRQIIDRLLEVTDLVLLDLKHIDEAKHRCLTGRSNAHILDFARYLAEKETPVWIRHVLVPGYTDDELDLVRLGQFIKTLPNVQKIEILPYHQLGVHKWRALGLHYPLADVRPPTDKGIQRAYLILTGKRTTV
ncbi:pyruvate formate-lyase-activating enzyme [Caldalkalibacillus thermarum]|uniref:pyruvate formate-lyase-activating protein n=1 Tax=Caldalkalibacillus thermarum TaxID=296745 RepID=UPI00166694DB|nr:pyruvate formate-lyase-activating protein [Caldalkalibacillus thermarum]GGK27763.1 pyruvate formate-lyase-activating enzyme [Caldalkalibacillus thermarum]